MYKTSSSPCKRHSLEIVRTDPKTFRNKWQREYALVVSDAGAVVQVSESRKGGVKYDLLEGGFDCRMSQGRISEL